MYDYNAYLKSIENIGNFIYFKEVIYPIAVVVLLTLILIVLIKYTSNNNKSNINISYQEKDNRLEENNTLYNSFSKQLVLSDPKKVFTVIILALFLGYIIWLIITYIFPYL